MNRYRTVKTEILTMKRLVTAFALFTALLNLLPARAGDALSPLDLRQVKVGGEIGRRIDITIANNLLVLDTEKDFLTPFRKKTGKDSYIGLGKLIDAAVKLAAYSGDPKVVAYKDRLIAETLKCQEPDGYLGTFPPDKRIAGLWDIHEMGYLMWGLLNDYSSFGDTRSLAGARKIADLIVNHWAELPADWGQRTLVAPHVAVTGLERAMLATYVASQERRYLDFCVKTRALPEWNLGIVIGRRAGIEGHVYAFMARCLAELELYRIQPEACLLHQSDRALDFMTRGDGMLITGSAGQYEIWTADQDCRGSVGETCALAYQLRVHDSLLRLRCDARQGDLMERTIFNALFASQSPDGRRLRYFAPLEGDRAYWKTDTYCCPCNFRRIIAELPGMVFYRCADGLAVNLYSPAEAKLTVAQGVPLSIREETDFPRTGVVRIVLNPARPVTFPVRCRIPAWAVGATVRVNGQKASTEVVPGTFCELRQEWKSGDQIVLDLPMKWRLVKGRERQAGRVAVMRGPQVFCLNPTQNKVLAKLDGADLGYLALAPDSLGEPVSDASVRRDGIGCRIGVWTPGMGLSAKTDMELTLSEFPDPDGKVTYFRLRDLAAAVDDELLGGGRSTAPSQRVPDRLPCR